MKRFLSVALLLTLATAAHAQLMDPALQARLDKAAPKLASKLADDALHGRLPGKRLFYTGTEIEHASQDGAGNRVGFYLSAHNRSANKDGFSGTDFQFPWKNPGGVTADNVYAWKVMFLPEGTSVRVHHTPMKSFFAGANGNVFFGRNGNVNGYGWTFPDGTRFYELLSFKDRLSVFEVRVRHKDGSKWRVNVYRPFVSRDDFVEAVNWDGRAPRQVWHIDDDSLHNRRKAFSATVVMEEVPGLRTTTEVDMLLKGRMFEPTLNRFWSEGSGPVPRTKSETAIIPKDYEGAFVGNDAASCVKCHQDAGTHVRFFHPNREWYGFVRGEPTEKILSFHPADPAAISRNGGHRDFQMNRRLVEAGIIQWRP